MWLLYTRLFHRNLFRHKYLSIFNLLGLGVAMGAFLLILHFVIYEAGYDRFHPSQDRLYRLVMTRSVEGQEVSKRADTYPAMAQALKNNYPGIAAICKVMYFSRGGTLTTFDTDNGPVLRDDIKALAAASDFFELFPLRMISGHPSDLDAPFTAFVSAGFALNLYGTTDVAGRTFTEDDGSTYIIKGVYKKWEGQSHLDFELIKSFDSIGVRHNSDMHQVSWRWDRMKTYVKLQGGIDPTAFEQQISQVVNDHATQRPAEDIDEVISLQAVKDIHLKSDFETTSLFQRAYTKVYGFLLIGLLVLLMGWLNFINHGIARGLDRIKEAGIQKVLGAKRTHLIRQHLFDALLMNIMAALVGLSLFQLFRPALNAYAGIPETFDLTGPFWFWLVAGVLVGTLISGLYPAMALSRVNTLLALKKKLSGFKGTLKQVRQSLNAFQFAISLSLLIAVLVIFQQVSYMQTVALGTRIDGVLIVKGPRHFNYDHFSANPGLIKEELQSLAGIEAVASSYAIPGSNIYAYEISRTDIPDTPKSYIPEHTVDHGFLSLYGLELVAGRDFSQQVLTDDSAAIINLSALRALGFENAEEALGARLTSPDTEFHRHIIGVIKDFHQKSPAFPMAPMLLGLDTESRGYYSLQFSTNDLPALQNRVQATFESVFPGNLYHSFLLSDYFEAQYDAENRLGSLLGVFALVAILLSGMGLFGMTYFSVIRRAKEMSIRKVLGAGFPRLLRHLGAEGSRGFLLGGMLTIPLVYMMMSEWLQQYHSRISLDWIHFVMPLLLLCALAYSIIVGLAFRSYQNNPVNYLREE